MTLDGETIGPGVVTFAPEDATKNPSKGRIDLQGRYLLITKHSRGLDPGTYRVAVQAYESNFDLEPGEIRWEERVPIVPAKYLSIRTTDLEYVVTAGSNTIDIELSTEGEPMPVKAKRAPEFSGPR